MKKCTNDENIFFVMKTENSGEIESVIVFLRVFYRVFRALESDSRSDVYE